MKNKIFRLVENNQFELTDDPNVPVEPQPELSLDPKTNELRTSIIRKLIFFAKIVQQYNPSAGHSYDYTELQKINALLEKIDDILD